MTLPRRDVLAAALLAGVPATPVRAAGAARSRGFSLIDKRDAATGRGPYREADFDIVAGWGFDFVRLPLDWRLWAAGGRAAEAQLAQIEQAIGWGGTRGIHVSLCLATAPGWSSDPRRLAAERASGMDLFGTGRAQDAARATLTAQWRMLARRFADHPSVGLSFALLGAPPDVSGEVYRAAILPSVAAVQTVSPTRVLVAEGTAAADGGCRPVPALAGLKLIQSVATDRPAELCARPAAGRFGADTWPAPQWPMPNLLSQRLAGGEAGALTLIPERPVAAVAVRVALAAGAARLTISADGVVVADQAVDPGAAGRDGGKSLSPPGGPGVGRIDRVVNAPVPASARRIVVAATGEGWVSMQEIRLFAPDGHETVLTPTFFNFGPGPRVFRVGIDGHAVPLDGPPRFDRSALWTEVVVPWAEVERRGVVVHVGAWGPDACVPAETAYGFLRDSLANFRRAGWGWAYRALRGDGGPIDGGRPGAVTSVRNGVTADWRMVELLQGG